MRIEGPGGPTGLPPEQQSHLTQAGETLRSISSQYNVDPESLKTHNNLTFGLDDSLKAGLNLQIPSRQAQPQATPAQGGTAELIEKVPDAYNPFVDPGSIGANWGDASPGPDPYDNPTWWEVEPPWMQQVSDESRVNPDPTKVINPAIDTKKTEE